MKELFFEASSEQQTERLGQALAACLPESLVISLTGTLGAGKTRLVKAIAAASNIDPATVSSPTFVLVHEYHGERSIYHMDAYRIKDDDEFLELGVEEYYTTTGLTFIEWADRVKDCLPLAYLEIAVEVTGETARKFSFYPQNLEEELIQKLATEIQRIGP